MKRFFNLIVSFFCGSSVFAQTTSTQSDGSVPGALNILFIGNSYTHMNSMPFIFDKIAKAKGKSVNVEMSTHSGFSFKQHSEREDMYEAIKSREWDYVILQGYSREFTHSFDTIDSASIPYIAGIIDTIRNNNPCTNFLFYMTWGYKNGYDQNEAVDSYLKMSDTIANGYQYISDYFKVPIVPVGRVWKKVREEHPEVNLYDSDLAHPSKNGSYLSACTFYTSIFRESAEGAFTKTIDATNAKIIQQAAAEYVLPKLHDLKLDSSIWDVQYARSESGEFIANLYANYPQATEVQWNLGDGTKTNEPILKHVYKKPGQYKVKLKVVDTCGVRHFEKEIIFKPLVAPAPAPVVQPKSKTAVTKRI